MADLIRLMVEPASPPGYFIARTEAGDFICKSRQPLADGSRVLLKRGSDPSAPLTMRHVGKSFDAFVAKPVSEWAEITYSERDAVGLTQEKWRPWGGPGHA